MFLHAQVWFYLIFILLIWLERYLLLKTSMKRIFEFLFFVVAGWAILLSGCRKAFDVLPSQGDFETSTDTVFLDSVFTGISSPTYSFKIYNRSGKNIVLKKIAPASGSNSFYRLNVDGVPGKVFEDVMIPARDSIYVFVELTADINALSDPVYEEPLLIEDESVRDTVWLVSFVKDAYFLYPRRFADHSVDSIQVGEYANGQPIRIPGFLISNDTTITADKPVVIYGHLGVPPGKTLTIEAGAHLYFHYNSGIVVYEDASIHINGTLGNEVILEDDRMQPDFENAPGMWNFIWLKEGSKNNVINYAVIKNAVAGVIAHPVNSNGDLVLNISNTQIYNMSAYGLFAAASYVKGHNLVFNNSGSSALNIQLGGQYEFKHCTFANYSSSVRNVYSAVVYVSNEYKSVDAQGNTTIFVNDLQQCDILNSIVYGNRPIEFFAVKNDAAGFQFKLSHSLVRFEDPNHEITEDYLDFTNTTYFSNNVLNANPDFENPDENKMLIGMQSAGIGIGDANVASSVPLDLLGEDRTSSPDAGAYQHTDFNN